MKEAHRLFLEIAVFTLLITVLAISFSSCDKKKDSNRPVDSSLDVVYTKSDAVKRVQSNNTYEMYGVKGKNSDGTVDLIKYDAFSADYGKTITMNSNSGEDVPSIVVDENTKFDIDALRDEGDTSTDLELFMSKIGARYNSNLIYFEMEITGNHADSVKFFKEYYR